MAIRQAKKARVQANNIIYHHKSTTKIRYAYVNLTPNRSKKNFSRINDILRSLEKIGVEILLRLTSLLLVKAPMSQVVWSSVRLHSYRF